MHVCVHAHIACMRARMHGMYTHMHVYMHACIHTNIINACIAMDAHTHASAAMYICTHTYINATIPCMQYFMHTWMHA